MTKCTQCGQLQVIQDESGQPACFCETCGGAVEVVSDELPFEPNIKLEDVFNDIQRQMEERQKVLAEFRAFLSRSIDEEEV